MAVLEVDLGGNVNGLGQAANQAIGILNNLKATADNLKLELFKATDVQTMNAVGGALTTVTNKIKEYTDSAIKGSTAFQDQKTSVILDSLSAKISILNDKAFLFGSTIQNQQAQIKVYENAITQLLGNGISPLDANVVSLKGHIDALTSSINATKAANSAAAVTVVSLSDQYAKTGKLIVDAETRVKRLKDALSNATDVRSIAQYNIRLQTAQVELDKLKNKGLSTGASLTASATSAANAAKKLSGGFNGVSTELGRIIQDAPFAANNFGAVGNNITRLFELLGGYKAQMAAVVKANGGAVTSMSVFKQGVANLFTGFGGLTLAISAVVSAYTFYQQSQQKAKRETDKLNGATVEYIETLKGVERMQLQGAKSAQQDLTNLKLLYTAYQDANVPLQARKDAYKQIQEQYPEYFKNIAFEQTASDKTRKAYDELTGSILSTARARAAANIITKNSERQLENENKIIKAEKTRLKQKRLVDKLEVEESQNLGATERGDVSNLNTTLDLVSARKTLLSITKTENNLKTDNKLLTEQNLALEKAANAELAKGATLIDLKNTKGKKEKAYVDRITPKVEKTTNDADLAGLRGNDIEVEKVRQKYVKLYADINKEAAKKGADLKNIAKLRTQAETNEAQEISQIIIAENERVASEVLRIQNESGIKASEDKDRELAVIQKWYDEQIKKAEWNAEIIAAIEEGAAAQRLAVDEKYRQKQAEAADKVNAKIQEVSDKSFTLNENNTLRGSRIIEEDLRKRLKAIKDYFTKLRELYKNDPLMQGLLNLREGTVVKDVTDKATAANDGGLGKELTKAVTKFGNDFYKTLSTINTQADQTFQGIFTSIVKSFTASMDDIFLNIFQKKATEALANVSTKLGTELTGAIAGVGLAGGIVSGITSKTSTAGQSIGGALSGAATGAMAGALFGPGGLAVGAVVGGLAGALSGIFGSSKARKEEELQKQQLEESKKQTALLERQNALAYTASIIGRMTTQGVVTGIEVNEYGQLVTKISGNDLSIILQRADASRKRGI